MGQEGKRYTAVARFVVAIVLVDTQLNSTQLTTPKEEWINKRKETKKLIYIPDSLVNSQDVS